MPLFDKILEQGKQYLFNDGRWASKCLGKNTLSGSIHRWRFPFQCFLCFSSTSSSNSSMHRSPEAVFSEGLHSQLLLALPQKFPCFGKLLVLLSHFPQRAPTVTFQMRRCRTNDNWGDFLAGSGTFLVRCGTVNQEWSCCKDFQV